MSQASPAPRGWLPPRVWAPIMLLLAVAAAALGTWGVMASGGDDDAAAADPGFCAPGDPRCALRQEVHWHADFAIYINGERLDFSDERYVSDEENPISPNAHIHHPRYHVVHVHREST